jgi:hypothetical protein
MSGNATTYLLLYGGGILVTWGRPALHHLATACPRVTIPAHTYYHEPVLPCPATAATTHPPRNSTITPANLAQPVEGARVHDSRSDANRGASQGG